MSEELSEQKAVALREAKIAELKEQIIDLEVCDCKYPLVVLRNVYGHRDSCPAYERIRKRREDREVKSVIYRR